MAPSYPLLGANRASPRSSWLIADGAAGSNGNLTTLAYPGTVRAQTLFTITHSTFGNQVVGNYDTGLATGKAFIYSIASGTYTTNNYPGALSTTAYGVWGDKIAGGYTPPGLGFERGYIYDQATGTWTTYNHPGALFTHAVNFTIRRTRSRDPISARRTASAFRMVSLAAA